MIRRLEFDGSSAHQIHFRLLFDAFRSRGSAPPDRRVSRDEKRADDKILRGLKAISEPVGGCPGEGELDVRPRTLRAGGGVMALEQHVYRQLQGYVEETQWMPQLSDVALELEDWLDTAEKAE